MPSTSGGRTVRSATRLTPSAAPSSRCDRVRVLWCTPEHLQSKAQTSTHCAALDMASPIAHHTCCPDSSSVRSHERAFYARICCVLAGAQHVYSLNARDCATVIAGMHRDCVRSALSSSALSGPELYQARIHLLYSFRYANANMRVRTHTRTHTLQEGLRGGDRVAVYGVNSREWMVAMQACNAQALACVPLYDSLGPSAIDFILSHATPKAVFVAGAKVPALVAAMQQASACEVSTARPIFTSCTSHACEKPILSERNTRALDEFGSYAPSFRFFLRLTTNAWDASWSEVIAAA